MAGFVGYCLHANGIQFPIHIPGDYSTKSPAELWDQVPESGKWQIILFVGFLEFFSECGRRAGTELALETRGLGRGAAAGALWIVRGGASRHRRGCLVDIPWRRVAAPPRVPRG